MLVFKIMLIQTDILNKPGPVRWVQREDFVLFYYSCLYSNKLNLCEFECNILDVFWNEKGRYYENIWKYYIIFVYKNQIQHYEFKIKLQSNPDKENSTYSREYINEIHQYSYLKNREKSWQPDKQERSFTEKNGWF